MKYRLTRKLILVAAIPLTFEIALISTCFVMANFTELKRANESITINALSKLAPILVSTIRTVTLTARAIINEHPIDRAQFEREKKDSVLELERFNAASSTLVEHQAQVASIGKNYKQLVDFGDEISRMEGDGTSRLNGGAKKNLQKLLDLKNCIVEIDESARIVVADLKERREDLRESSAKAQDIFQFVLWLSLGLSFTVALAGLLVFRRLILRPLNDLTRLSTALASGEKFVTAPPSNDEIGDLIRSFQNMAEELERRKRIERAIFDNSAEIICAIDAHNDIKFVNTFAQVMLGFTPAELTDEKIYRILPASHRMKVVGELAKIREKAAIGSFESKLTRKNGTAINTLWSVRWSDLDQLLYCSIYDVDYEKQTEEMTKNLSALVVGELNNSIVEAKNAVRAIDKTGFAGASKLDVLDMNFSRIGDLLQNLGQAISSESTELTMHPQPVAARELIDTSVSSLAFLAQKKRVEIECIVEDIEVNVDAVQIQRVIINLLSNALKVSPNDGKIVIEMGHSSEDGWVSLDVTDEGPGIPLAKQHMLFERFQQVGTIQSEEGKGSGLGLFSARQIIEAHGGTLGVISDGRSGSTFGFSIPVEGVT